MNSVGCALDQARGIVACQLGEGFNVYRPNFNQVDQTPALIGKLMANMTPGGDKFAIPKVPGVNYFTVTCSRLNLKFGDILIPTSPTSASPVTTILNFSDDLPLISFRTSRLGDVVLSTNSGDQVYTNLYFDFLHPMYFNNDPLKQLGITGGVTTKRIVMWSRKGVQEQNAVDAVGNVYSLEGLKIVARDGAVPVRYLIKNSVSIGNIFMADIAEEVDD